MRLTVVGCGDAFGSGGRFNTCFHLQAAGKTFLIDCGASTHVALNAQGIDANDIDAIILSHLHGDHFGGIPFLLLYGQFLKPRERPLLFAGPPGSTERINALVEACLPTLDQEQMAVSLECDRDSGWRAGGRAGAQRGQRRGDSFSGAPRPRCGSAMARGFFRTPATPSGPRRCCRLRAAQTCSWSNATTTTAISPVI